MDDLGGFAAEAGPPHRLSVLAATLAAAAAFAAAWRPLMRAAGRDPAWATSASAILGFAGIAAALAAMYIVSSRGAPGTTLAKRALAASSLALVGGFVAGAIASGTLQPERFVDQYFNREILAQLPGDLGRGMVNTLKLAVVAQGLAMLLGLIAATFMLSPRRSLRYPAIIYVDVIRGLPLVVLTFLIHFGLPNVGITLGGFASPVIILALNAGAYIAEIFRAGIQSLPRGQMDAARSLGMPYSVAMTSVIIPQASRAVIPPLVSEFIALIKDTAIVIALIGFTVATRDVFGAARQAASSTFSPTPYIAAAVAYLLITIPLARSVGRLERRLRAGIA